MNAPEYNDRWCIMTKSRSFGRLGAILNTNVFLNCLPAYMVFHITAKVWTKPEKAASEQSDAGGFGNVCTFSYQSEKYIRFLSLGRFCSHGIFHNTSSLNFNGLKKLVFSGRSVWGTLSENCCFRKASIREKRIIFCPEGRGFS